MSNPTVIIISGASESAGGGCLGFIIVFIMIWGPYSCAKHLDRETHIIEVKETFAHSSAGEGRLRPAVEPPPRLSAVDRFWVKGEIQRSSPSYAILNNITLRNRPSWLEGKSANDCVEIQQMLSRGGVFKIRTYGWELGWLFHHENIIEVERLD